jgi:hypothetical protein
MGGWNEALSIMAVVPFGTDLMNFALNHSMNEALVVFSE